MMLPACVVVVVILLVLTAVAATRAAMRHLVSRGRRLTGAAQVEELSAWMLGGIRQWVQLRGEDSANPLLIYLHGGPGQPIMPFAHQVQRSWEEHFTVVQWDQRNTGKTLTLNGVQTDNLDVGRYVHDGLDLVRELRARFPGRPIVLLGHSWGTVLAIEMLRREPDYFAAYLAVGQVSDFLKAERHSYMKLVAAAERTGARRITAMLKQFPDYPHGDALRADSLRAVRGAAMKLGFGDHHDAHTMRKHFVLAFRSPDYSWRDLMALTNRTAQAAGLDLALTELPRFIDRVAGSTFTCPVIMVGGAFDLFTPTPMAREFFDGLQVPYKEFVEVEDLGHFGPFEDQALFNDVLINRIRPLVTAGTTPKAVHDLDTTQRKGTR